MSPTAADLVDTGVRLLAGTIVDNAGVTRVKTVPGARIGAATTRGIGMSPVFSVMCVDDHITATPAYGGPSGDMRLFPDLDSAAVLDPVAGLAWAPLDQYDQDLRPMDICQRQALRRVERESAEAGLGFRLAFELEFTVLRGDPDAPTIAHNGPGYGARPLLELEAFSLDLVDALEQAGVDVEQLHPEYGPGQLEVSLGHDTPTRATDKYVLARLVIGRTALRHGLRVSFAPLTVPGGVGNGAHVHFSAYRDGRNLFAGGEGMFGMTVEGENIVAGVVDGLQETAGLYTPSALSYERLVPGHWSGAYACWGLENREAAVRFIAGTSSVRAEAANCEIKAVDGASNPYLVAAAILARAQHGVRHWMTPPTPVAEDPDGIAAAERERLGVRRLPTSLGEALDALEKSSVLRDALGPALLDTFVAVRRYEVETYADLPLPERIAALRWRY